jgi:peptidoglycan/LPS O-acetylase OafA/YrhL
MSSGLSAFLNLSRWAAAFLVLIGHVRHLILVDLKSVTHGSIVIQALYFITGLGHEAVVIFFVISGLLVGGTTIERWSFRSASLSTFAIARVSRIYTVLIPALLIGYALDQIGLHWFNASGLYSYPEQYHTISLEQPASAALSLTTMAGNLLMMQGILTKTLGSNTPLWSLSYEWWYYCLFAATASAVFSNGGRRLGFAAAAIFMGVLLPAIILLWGTIWALGIGAHAWTRSRAWRPHPALGFGLFLIAVVISRLSHNMSADMGAEPLSATFARDAILAAGFFAAILAASRVTGRIPLARLNEALAEFSYTTYLCHFPAMMFIVAVLFQAFGVGFRVQPTATGMVYFVLLSVAVCLWCFAISRLTERHTEFVRLRLRTISDKLSLRIRSNHD